MHFGPVNGESPNANYFGVGVGIGVGIEKVLFDPDSDTDPDPDPIHLTEVHKHIFHFTPISRIIGGLCRINAKRLP
jgi:hypothetical protein